MKRLMAYALRSSLFFGICAITAFRLDLFHWSGTYSRFIHSIADVFYLESWAIPSSRGRLSRSRALRDGEEQDQDACEFDVAWKISAADWYAWMQETALGERNGANMFLNCFDTVRSPLTLMNAVYFSGKVVAPREIIIPHGGYGLDMRLFMEDPSAFPPEHEFFIGYARQSKTATTATITWVSLKAEEITSSLMLKNTALFEDLHKCDPTQPSFASHLSDDMLLCNLVQVHPQDVVCIQDLENETMTDACRSRIVDVLKQIEKLEVSREDAFRDQPSRCKVSELLVDDDQREAIDKMSFTFHETQCMLATNCLDTESKLPYDVLYVCHLGMNKLVAFPVVTAMSVFWFIAMGILADVFLVPTLVELGKAWHMSDALVGATLLALGDGCNDFMTGFVSVLSSRSPQEGEAKDGRVVEMWLGSLFGSVIFVNALCASLVLLVGGLDGVSMSQKEFLRNVGFQILSVLLMAVYGIVGFIHWTMALLMMLVYVVYVVLILCNPSGVDPSGVEPLDSSPTVGSNSDVVWCCRVARGQRVVSFGSLSHQHEGSQPAASQARSSLSMDSAHTRSLPLGSTRVQSEGPNTLCSLMGYEADGSVMDMINFILGLPLRPLFLLTMALTEWHPCLNVLLPIGMCVFIPFGNFFGNMYETAFDDFNMTTVFVLAFWTVGVVLSLWCGFASRRSPGVYIAPMLFFCTSFVVALFWLSTMCSEVVGAMQTMGFICNIPPEALGLTLLAWGNSIDTLFSMIALAKAGQFGIAVTAIYAGPMFILLFGTGFNLMVLSIKEGGRSDFTLSVSSWIVLIGNVLILIATTIYAKAMGWRLTKRIGYMLFISYASVVVLAFVINEFLANLQE